MIRKVRTIVVVILLATFPFKLAGEELLPLAETFNPDGDRVYPWIRCAAFYQATVTLSKRRGNTSLVPDLLEAENDMIIIAGILIRDYADVDDLEALARVDAELVPLVGKYEVMLANRQNESGVVFWQDEFWKADGAVCAEMRDVISPLLNGSE